MKLTNNFNLPEPLVEAIRNDSYSGIRKARSISVTTLLKPPRIVALERTHHDEIETDAIDNIWSLIGQSIHGILERANKTDIVEVRHGIEFEGWYINGQLDSYTLANGLLRDWKTVSAWAVVRSSKETDWTEQLNIYIWLLRKKGFDPKAAEVVAIIRDWSKREAARNPEYPQKQVVVIPLEVWDNDRTEQLIRSRLLLHEAAETELPLCSASERWQKPEKFACMKKGRKTAVKLFDSRSDCEAWMDMNRKPGEVLTVETRPSESVRCQHYCAVAPFCAQWRDDPNNVAPPADLVIDV